MSYRKYAAEESGWNGLDSDDPTKWVQGDLQTMQEIEVSDMYNTKYNTCASIRVEYSNTSLAMRAPILVSPNPCSLHTLEVIDLALSVANLPLRRIIRGLYV